ncbi:MAG: hypothetical protein D6766_07675 [Verrucomicrobia bacterium]|nr:MAG: hypothetical protein D6766_07675 [Verrucomicrobiota bacterium]
MGALFLFASVLKAGSLDQLVLVLLHDGIPMRHAALVGTALCYVEAVVGVLLIFNVENRVLFFVASGLLVGFTVQLVYLGVTQGPPCMCFGRYNWLFGRTSNMASIIQNAFLLTLLILTRRRFLISKRGPVARVDRVP